MTAVLEERASGVIIRDMLTTNRAIGLFLDDIVRQGGAERTRDSYRRMLDHFLDTLPLETDVSEVREEDVLRFLGRFTGVSPKTGKKYAQGTRVQADAPLRSFFKWLKQTRKIKNDPMEYITRPRRLHYTELDVVSVTTEDVIRMLDVCDGWREQLTMGILCGLGPRRRAVALVRLSDYDRPHRLLRFYEKGGKVIWKTPPDDLCALLDSAVAAGLYESPDDYLIPPAGPLSKAGDRSDRFVWDIVKRIAAKAGVEAHVHALRAAFACFYADGGYGDLDELRQTMGHRSEATTLVYLRRRSSARAKENVRSLSWRQPQQAPVVSVTYPSGAESLMGAGGFEPPSVDSSILEPPSPDGPREVMA